MMKIMVAIGLLVSTAAHADVDAYFAAGVLNVPWGSTVQQTRSAHPDGVVWPNKNHTADDGYIYEVDGEFRVLGLNYPARHAQFKFSKDDRLNWASIHFPYADRDEVLYSIAQVLGQNYEIRDELNSRVFAWKPGLYAVAELVISSDARLPWAYLRLHRK